MHPTQLYESLNGLVLLGLVLLVRRYRKFSGEMFVAFTMGYAVLRYYVEILRADEQRGNIGPLSTSQFIGVATFTAGAALLVVALLALSQAIRSRCSCGSTGRRWCSAPRRRRSPARRRRKANPNAERRRRKKRS